MSAIKRESVRLVLAAVLILTIVSYFVPYRPLESVVSTIVNASVIISAFALPVGAVNIIRYNLTSITKRKEEWYLNVWLLFCIALAAIPAVFYGQRQPIYQWIYNNVNLPAGSAISSTTAFFCATAMYRAFRVRNMDSFLLMVCCAITMLMNAPIGETIWSGFPIMGRWLSDYSQNTGVRLIWIGVGVGFVALCVRYIMGKETSLTGGE